jgi:uncharacterized protein YndB with AHSA1/START domain
MSEKINTATEAATRSKIIIERTYQASVEELWELWTTKDGFESWWGPGGFRAEVHAIEARSNGELHYEMIADAPEMVAAMKEMGRAPSHVARARFSEFRPYERLVLAHVVDFLPGVKPYDSMMMVEFFPTGEWVRMVVTLSPMHDEEFTKMSADGFASQLTKLDRRFPSRHQ